MEAPRLDILTANAGDVVRRAQARDLGAELVQAVFRLVKLATLHALENQAVVRQVDETVRVVTDYCQRADRNVSILFARGSVFVAGQLLKANRSTYEEAAELGQVLRKIGVGELGIARDVRAPDLNAFVSSVADALRSGRACPERITPRVRLRPVGNEARVREEETLDEDKAITSTYAAAVVIMRRFYEDLERGRYVMSQRVRRVAQRLVDLSAGGTPAFLGVTAARNANADDAGRAVNTAILSLAMARQITSDPVTLVRLAIAALLFDTARPRLTGRTTRTTGIVPVLSAEQDAEVPAGTAVVLTALGRVNEPTVVRTVVAYEAQWLKRQAALGPLYGGLRTPTLHARIVYVARAFNDLLTPTAGQSTMSADEAIAALEAGATAAADRTVLRLLVAALGIFSTGTLVELTTGEVALVVKTPDSPALYSLPQVRLVFDRAGGAIARPIEINLAEAPRSGEPRRFIKSIVATSDDPNAASMRSLAKRAPADGRGRSGEPPGSGSGVRDPTSSVSAISGLAPPSSAPSISTSPLTPAMFAVPAILPPTTRDWPESAPPVVARSEPAVVPGERQAPSVQRSSRAAAPPPGPVPTAQGDLLRTPLVHLLVYMLDQRLTGTTVLQTPERSTHAVYFEHGIPCKIRTAGNIAPLDRLLLELGLLDEDTLRASLIEISKTKMLHGRHLVARGLLDRETVVSVLRLQLIRKLMYLFELAPETRYAYYEGVNLLETYGGPELVPCDPLAVIMAGVRLRAADPLVDATLQRIAQRPLAIHPGVDLRRFELQRDESVIVDLLRTRRHTLAELVATGVAQPRVVSMTIYALAITRHLDFGVPGRPPVGLDTSGAVDVSALGVPSSPTAPVHTPAGSEQSAPSSPSSPSRPSAPPIASSPTPASAPQPGSRVAAGAAAGARAARTGFGIRFGRPPSGLQHAGAVRQAPPPPAPPPSAPSHSPSPSYPSYPGQPGPPSGASSPDTSRRPSYVPASQGARPPSPSWPGQTTGTSSYPPGTPPSHGGRASASPIPAPRASSPSIPDAPISYGSGPRSGLDVSARRAEIQHRMKTIDSENFFQMLAVATTATAEEIQAAYFALARQWHPDRQPIELADLKPQVARIFGRISEAYHTLSDTRRRSDYQHLVAAGGGTQDDHDKIARVVDAALEFQKAEVLFRKHDLVGAEVLARRAVEADPEQPEYTTLLVWIQAHRRGDPSLRRAGETSTIYDDLIKQLDEVIKQEPHYERALFYRGMLLKRCGRMDRGIRDLRLAAELNPKNIDAVREVRLYHMRSKGQRTAPPPSGGGRKQASIAPKDGGGGLFGKLFKK